MKQIRKLLKYIVACTLLSATTYAQNIPDAAVETNQKAVSYKNDRLLLESKIINNIIVRGNQHTPTGAILNHVPYKIGQPYRSQEFIKELYHSLKRLRSIAVSAQLLENDQIDIFIDVTEKIPVDLIVLEGNKHLQSKEILKTINADDLVALDPEELHMLINKIKKIYLEKGYYSIGIDAMLVPDATNCLTTALFKINEGRRSVVKRINFKGNCAISDKELRSALLTKEDWILGFLDKAGTYHPEKIMYGDTQMLEQLYQNRGFLYAKVLDVITDVDPYTLNIDLTFVIEEGKPFTIANVDVQSTDEFNKEYLLNLLPVRPGMLYSRDLITSSIKRLERAWGNLGFIFTHVEPSIIPNDTTQTIDLSFRFERGKQMFVNRITVLGNKKTRDKVIRRKILLNEGDLLTQLALDNSKQGVEALGYFEQRDGVDWKIRRISNELADLDLFIKERKTGHFGTSFSFGGSGIDLSSPVSGLSAKLELSDTNLFGSGLHLNMAATWAKEEQTLLFHIDQPWMFDRPILGALDLYHKRPVFDELHNLDVNAVYEKLTGGALTGGIITQSAYRMFQDTQILGSLGIDSIRYAKEPHANINVFNVDTSELNREFNTILRQAFTPGDFLWLSNGIEQDVRNHPLHPSRGHRWKLASRIAIPSFDKKIGFYKVSLDAHWFTSLIEEYGLVLHLHGFFGVAAPFSNHLIPFGELFHIGGPASVRGFKFGEIGPKFLGDTTIGAKKAFFINTELIFPITSDYTMKGVVFYDGGASWDNPYLDHVSRSNITGNSFDYRHAVGIGIRLLNPMPIRVDWGFKIDPRKNRLDHRRDESASEVHFGMAYDW